ncbi:cell wall hydrolase [Bacillus sp. CGMCC 1.16607]|uniref:cell wall hydrolase n=1 Tax=Bacillus sp. CGMCC 1.16607 TaxID=3351842 RepID=UPI0036294EDE
MKKLMVVTIILMMSFLFAAPTLAYTVQERDTMTKIAFDHNLTLQELAELNPHIQNLNFIYVGDTINTEKPSPTVYSYKKATYSDVDIYDGQALLQSDVPMIPESSIENESQSPLSRYTDEEIDLLARLVRAEAQIEPFEGKVAVACVVLNRVDNSQFPDTIHEVIYEPGQFQPVSNGEINKPADNDSIEAVKAAITEQRHLAEKSLFFYNPTIATSRWLDTRPTTIVIGQHVFKN